jgi:hypothetical protein
MKLVGREEIAEPDTVGDWLRRMGDPKSGQLGLDSFSTVSDNLQKLK